MEGQDALANGGATPDSPSFGDTLVGGQGVLEGNTGHDKRNGNLADEVLEGLEEYWEDIHDRLMISRMVSDSLIKGMVTAKEQEAAQTITAKELELANLKDLLRSNCARCSCLPGMHPGKTEILRQELPSLKNLGVEQLINIKKEIEFARRKIEPDSNGDRRGGDLSEKWVHIDELLGNLEKTFDVICTKADGVCLSSCELQEERDLLANVEGIVIETVLMKFKEEFEDKLLTRNNSQLSRIQSMDWLGKFQELSKLGTQLDAILKSLSIHDSGLVSHGTHDLDHLHHKTLNNHVRVRMSPSGENGTLDAANVHVAEIYDFQQLKHLSKEGLVDYFNDIIIKMKRDHESVVHQKTEEYFRLKREYLKEPGSSVTHRKDEEFDVLRRKIPEVISKFEDFLVENERFPALASTSESIEKMEHRLESLLSENHQLRDHLTNKEKEVKHLEEQSADAAAQLLHSLSKEPTLQLVENLNSAMEELQIEALLKEEVFKCALREQIAETRSDWEYSHMEFLFTEEIYDIILRGAIIPAETNDKYESEDSDVKALISNGFCGLMCGEAIKDAEQKLNDLTQEILKNKDVISCLEVKALEKENELRQVVEEKENLKQEILDLGTTLGQKEKLASDLSSSLSKKREQLELASQELDNLRQHASQQQTSITESNQELQSLRSEHLEALEQIQIVKLEMHKLNQMLDESKELLEEANQQRNIAFSHTQEMHEKLHSVEAREEKLKKEVEVAVGGFSKMFDDFEFCVSQAVIKNSLRLEDTRSHLKALIGMASALKRTERMYEQRLERRFTDLQMAEVEVDLLGDEVGALLRLLEKIYVALDHYSPVLKHYPGIIEILKLVRRELTGESAKI